MEVNNFPIEHLRSIENDIVQGILNPGISFSTNELRSNYGISDQDFSIITKSLYRKGLIAVEGDNVRILGLPEAKVTSVFQYAQKNQLKPSTVVRKVDIIPAEADLPARLMVDEGSPLFVQVRTRMVNDEILANQYNFIPYEICPGLESIDLSKSSFQVALEKEFHTVITRFHEDYIMSSPNRDDPEILQISEKEKVLVVQRTSYAGVELPVVFADIHVNPKLFHLVKDLWPEANPLIEKYFLENQ
jgi:hypothetical protein